MGLFVNFGGNLPGANNTTLAVGEEGGGLQNIGIGLPGFGGGLPGVGNTTLAVGEEGGGALNTYMPGAPGNTTLAVGEEGGGSMFSSSLFPLIGNMLPLNSNTFFGGGFPGFSSSFPISGFNPLSGLGMFGLSPMGSGFNTTLAVGESGGGLTGLFGGSGPGNTTLAIGEEGGGFTGNGLTPSGIGNTTLAIGEEGGGLPGAPTHVQNTTLAVGEEGGGLAGLL